MKSVRASVSWLMICRRQNFDSVTRHELPLTIGVERGVCARAQCRRAKSAGRLERAHGYVARLSTTCDLEQHDVGFVRRPAMRRVQTGSSRRCRITFVIFVRRKEHRGSLALIRTFKRSGRVLVMTEGWRIGRRLGRTNSLGRWFARDSIVFAQRCWAIRGPSDSSTSIGRSGQVNRQSRVGARAFTFVRSRDGSSRHTLSVVSLIASSITLTEVRLRLLVLWRRQQLRGRQSVSVRAASLRPTPLSGEPGGMPGDLSTRGLRTGRGVHDDYSERVPGCFRRGRVGRVQGGTRIPRVGRSAHPKTNRCHRSTARRVPNEVGAIDLAAP